MTLGIKREIVSDKWNEEFISSLRPEAEKMLSMPIETLPYTEFFKYYETGSRVEYEQLYMQHRKRLWHFAAMALWEDDSRWIDGLCDILTAICGEFAWTFPAHADKNLSYSDLRGHIDLFSAETAQTLSETLYLLSDRLPGNVVDMVRSNLMERIVEPYLKGGQDFPKNNWQAVCNGCVAMCIMELGLDDVFWQVKDRVLQGMQIFLDSYPEDGICLEGPIYWTYGFGYFAFTAAMLREYTNGAIDLFRSEKVKNMAHFYEWAFVGDEYTVPFADAGHILYLNPGLIGFLQREYGTDPISYAAASKYGYDIRWRFADMVRNLIWKESFAEQKSSVCEKYFPHAEWYYNRKSNYTLVAKCGNNEEPHNHNDIGSFVVYTNGVYVVDDLGWPEYDKNYFHYEYRYRDYICASSLGHSVPIVNGKPQLWGADKKGSVLCNSDDRFILDLSESYDLSPGSVKREIACNESSVSLTDTVSEGNTLISRIALRVKPEVVENGIKVGNATITSSSPVQIKFSEQVFESRYTIGITDMGRFVTAYLVDFVPEKGNKVELKININN